MPRPRKLAKRPKHAGALADPSGWLGIQELVDLVGMHIVKDPEKNLWEKGDDIWSWCSVQRMHCSAHVYAAVCSAYGIFSLLMARLLWRKSMLPTEAIPITGPRGLLGMWERTFLLMRSVMNADKKSVIGDEWAETVEADTHSRWFSLIYLTAYANRDLNAFSFKSSRVVIVICRLNIAKQCILDAAKHNTSVTGEEIMSSINRNTKLYSLQLMALWEHIQERQVAPMLELLDKMRLKNTNILINDEGGQPLPVDAWFARFAVDVGDQPCPCVKALVERKGYFPLSKLTDGRTTIKYFAEQLDRRACLESFKVMLNAEFAEVAFYATAECSENILHTILSRAPSHGGYTQQMLAWIRKHRAVLAILKVCKEPGRLARECKYPFDSNGNALQIFTKTWNRWIKSCADSHWDLDSEAYELGNAMKVSLSLAVVTKK